jgi:hypothetical protein
MGSRHESRAVAIALHCYPKRWRARHGEEATEVAQLLAGDGVPVASIALSYVGGAVRERLAPLFRRRWGARAVALLATASVAVTVLAMSSSPAPAGALGVVRVEVAQKADAIAELTSAFRSHHLPIAVRAVAAPPREVGSIVATLVAGPPSPTRPVIGEVKGLCANGASGCIVGLVIPANFTGNATVLVGR